MHWLLLLSLLDSSTALKNGGSPSTLNKLAETSLRRQLGDVQNVRVVVAPGQGQGDFNSFDVTLDGFSADRLMNLANKTSSSQSTNRSFDARDLEDILGGIGKGNVGSGGKYGDILGGVLGGAKSGGRIGRVRLKATNFSFQGARYESMSADLGEIKFDWRKALTGNFDIKSVSPGTLALSVRGDQAAKLLAPRLPSVSDVRVRFSDGRAFVGAKSGLYGVRVPFEVGARLSVQQNRVMATDFAASVSKLRLPSVVVNELTRGLNPLYDFDPQGRWPLAINLSTAQATGDVLAMRGGVQWLGLGGRRNDSSRDNNTSSRDSGDIYPNEAPRSKPRVPDVFGDIFGR